MILYLIINLIYKCLNPGVALTLQDLNVTIMAVDAYRVHYLAKLKAWLPTTLCVQASRCVVLHSLRCHREVTVSSPTTSPIHLYAVGEHML